jgi:hypothetical protein
MNIFKSIAVMSVRLTFVLNVMAPWCYGMSQECKVEFFEESYRNSIVVSEISIRALLFKKTECVGEASFVLYEKVASQLLPGVLVENCLAQNDFDSILPDDGNVIIFKNIRIHDEHCQRKGYGTKLLTDSFGYLNRNYSGYTMIGYAAPYGQHKLSLEQLCSFYIKHGMKVLKCQGSTCASIFMITK